MNLKARVEKLEQNTPQIKHWNKITVNNPSDDVTTLMQEQLEPGEETDDFNWIVRRIVDPN